MYLCGFRCSHQCLQMSCIFKWNEWWKRNASRSFKRAHNRTTNLLNRRQLFALLTHTHTHTNRHTDMALDKERRKKNSQNVYKMQSESHSAKRRSRNAFGFLLVRYISRRWLSRAPADEGGERILSFYYAMCLFEHKCVSNVCARTLDFSVCQHRASIHVIILSVVWVSLTLTSISFFFYLLPFLSPRLSFHSSTIGMAQLFVFFFFSLSCSCCGFNTH